MKKILVAMLVCGMFLPLMIGGGATAQEKKGKTPEERFAALDKNGDKKLSKEEYLAQITDETKKEKGAMRFATADKNNDGFLSLEEFKEIPMGKKKN
jgi:Ca2+-binding EF-hand superfamily protein